MKKILHIISSPNGEASQSIKLGKAIIEKIKIDNPNSLVTETNLPALKFPHLEESQIAGFFTPAENHNLETRSALENSDKAIQDVFDADIIVIGAPLYNFAIHSTLKAWIDHIVRRGMTFTFGEKGMEGLVINKKVYLAVSSGGIYSEGPMQSFDFVVPYLKTVLGSIGLTDISVFRIEGTAIPGMEQTAVEKGLESITV